MFFFQGLSRINDSTSKFSIVFKFLKKKIQIWGPSKTVLNLFYPFPLLSYYHPTTIPLLSHYHPTTIKPLSHHHLTMIPLLSHYHPTTIPLLSHHHPTTIPPLFHHYPTTIPLPSTTIPLPSHCYPSTIPPLSHHHPTPSKCSMIAKMPSRLHLVISLHNKLLFGVLTIVFATSQTGSTCFVCLL